MHNTSNIVIGQYEKPNEITTPIKESFACLKASLEELAVAIAQLDTRLAPIVLLRGGDGKEQTAIAEPVRSPFNQAVVDQSRAVRSMINQVRNLTDSLEI